MPFQCRDGGVYVSGVGGLDVLFQCLDFNIDEPDAFHDE